MAKLGTRPVSLNDAYLLSDFDEVVVFLTTNLVRSEVHGFDKLLIDDGNTQSNCLRLPKQATVMAPFRCGH
jgi:hypothetical protein